MQIKTYNSKTHNSKHANCKTSRQGRALTDAFTTKYQQNIQKLIKNNVKMLINQIL